MKQYKILGYQIEAEKFNNKLKTVLKEAGIIFISAACGFAVWLIMSL